MSNLHKDVDDNNKHTALGFTSAGNMTVVTKNERGEQTFERMPQLLSAINFVDGNAVPPTSVSGDIYVLIDLGNGAVDAAWDGAAYNDFVRFTNGEWVAFTPIEGQSCRNIATGKMQYFDGVDWIEEGAGGGTDYAQTLIVDNNGDDSTAVRGDVTKPFKTCEAARDAAVAGDTIKVISDITVTTTDANGLWKDGVHWEFLGTTSKSTANPLWRRPNTATLPSNIYGYSNFIGTASCGRLVDDQSLTLDMIFEYNTTSNTNSDCFWRQGGTGNIYIKERLSSNSTAGRAIYVGGATNLIIESNTPKSTVSEGIFLGTIANGNVNFSSCENTSGGAGLTIATNYRGTINGAFVNRATLTTSTDITFNVARCTILDFAGDGDLIANTHAVTYNHTGLGFTKNLNANTVNISGGGTVRFRAWSGNTVSVTGSNRVHVEITAPLFTTAFTATINCSNANARIDMLGEWFDTVTGNISAGRLNIKGYIRFRGFVTFTGVNYCVYQTGGTIYLTGTADFSEITNTNLIGFWKDGGGTFISNGGTIIVNNQDQIGVGDPDSVQDIKIYSGGLNTNQTSFLAAKTGTLGLVDLVGGTIIEDADIIS